MANLITWASFNLGSTLGTGLNQGGAGIGESLIFTTASGGASGKGTVFGIESDPFFNPPSIQINTLAAFDGTDGADPRGTLVTDAAGDLFGVTYGGGTNGDGTVFEIAKTATGYASTPTTLVNFTSLSFQSNQPASGGLVMDSAGDLFGTTEIGGIYGDGTVFEIAKTANGYASTPITLLNFNGANGQDPIGTLMMDSSGNLIGTTSGGGPSNLGTVFEIAKTAGGYANTPTTISLGSNPFPAAGLIADAEGDLFGTSLQGGPDSDGTVFEIAKTANGYASTPITLATFNGTDGEYPSGPLIMDAAGNLFGVTALGGSDVTGGTVFEIAKTANGYASAPTVLGSFNYEGLGGANPYGSLVADDAGNLFGIATNETTGDSGTVFEVTSSGFVPLTVSISGVALDGKTLTADVNGDVATYQWQELIDDTWTNISGATNATYQVQDSDTGRLISVAVTGNNGLTATSVGNLVLNLAPTVTISGTAQQGQTLTANTIPDVVAYEWQELVGGAWTIISGASGATYQMQATDVGRQIRVQVVNSLNISATSVATNSIRDADGNQPVYETDNGSVIGSGQFQLVYGTVTNATVNSGGEQNIYSGGTATGTTLNAGSVQIDWGIANGTTIAGGNQYVDGVALNATILSGGQYINSGGDASGTTVDSNGEQDLYTYATSYGTTLLGGTQGVYGAVVDHTTIDTGGVQFLHGTATNTTVNSGGQQDVFVDGSASWSTLNAGGTQTDWGAATDTTIAGGAQYVYGTSNDTTITSGIQHVYSGGSAIGTTVDSGGEQDVYTGATASTTMLSGGVQGVYGATVDQTTIDAGGLQILHGTATNTTVNSGGEQNVYADGTAFGTTLDGGGVQIDWGNAIGTTINSGNEYVYGRASDTTINAGNEFVEAGGFAGTTTIDGGTEYVGAGGIAGDVTFDGSGGLVLDQTSDLEGPVVGFGAANSIDLSFVSFSSAGTTLGYQTNSDGLPGGTLTVTDGTNVATLALLGQYSAASFALASDGHGGTFITEPNTTSPNSLAAPLHA